MNEQKVFQQVLARVHQLDTQIHLKIPADQASIQQQINRIETAEQHLKVVKTQVLRRLAKVPNDSRSNGSQQSNYRSLIQRIEKALRNAANFKHLAEEFFIDPEGVVSLLQGVNQDGSQKKEIGL
jgi:YesN/AraC family two-component response regulator